MFRPTIPNTSGDRPLMVIIRRSITRKSALDSGSARVFTSEASSAALDGAVGAGVQVGSATRSIRTTIFSIAMVSMTSMVAGRSKVGVPGRTTRVTDWGFLTPMVRCPIATVGPPARAGEPAADSLADRDMPRRGGRRSIGRIPVATSAETSVETPGTVEILAPVLSNRGPLLNNAVHRLSGLAPGASHRDIPAGTTARSAESSRAARPGNRATMATPAWERSELSLPVVEQRRRHEVPVRLAAAGGDRR